MKRIRRFTFLASLVVVSACSTLPPYKAEMFAESDQANLDLSRVGSVWLWIDGTGYNATAPKNSLLSIPADGRLLTVYKNAYYAGYSINYTCNPGFVFQPQKEKTYLLNFEWEEEACLFEIFERDSSDARTGLRLVPKHNLVP